MAIRRGVALALALLPWACALHLPRLVLGETLEQHVDTALPLAVGAAASLSLLLNTALVSAPRGETPLASSVASQLARGLVGLLVGTALCHVAIVVFGAPFEYLVQRTALLALLLASLTTLPLAMHAGLAWRDGVDIVLTLRARDDVDVHVASVALAAALGAYLGALPIPLDWDRPWQQWPLTCVYGALGGASAGHAAGVAIAAYRNKRKTE